MDWVELKIYHLGQNGTANAAVSSVIRARKNGSSELASRLNEISAIGDLTNASGNGFGYNMSIAKVPVASKVFEVEWSSAMTVNQIYVTLYGYGNN